ncbi:MAG: BrnT family toxin [Acidobacteriota bacterium]
MGFEWDPIKAESNVVKYGVDFADAALALEDELAVTIMDPMVDHEERFVTIGMTPDGRLVVVVYTWRGEAIRLISARRATSAERRHYERQSG